MAAGASGKSRGCQTIASLKDALKSTAIVKADVLMDLIDIAHTAAEQGSRQLHPLLPEPVGKVHAHVFSKHGREIVTLEAGQLGCLIQGQVPDSVFAKPLLNPHETRMRLEQGSVVLGEVIGGPLEGHRVTPWAIPC